MGEYMGIEFQIKMSSKAPPSVNTGDASAPWMAHIDKLPPQVQEPLKVRAGDIAKTPNEAHVRSMAAAQTLLMLWAVSASPWMAILFGLVALVLPKEVSAQLVVADGFIRKGLKAIP